MHPRAALPRVIAVIRAAALTLAGVVVFAPQTHLGQWLSTRLLIAQALAFPGLTGAGLVAGGAIALALGATVPVLRQSGARLAAVVMIVLGLGLGVFPDGPPWVAGPSAAAGNTGRTLRVSAFNSLDTLSSADVQEILGAADPDVLVLPEASPGRVAEAVAGTAFAPGVHATPDAGFSSGRLPWVAPTAVVVHPRGGAYRSGTPTPTTFGSVRLDPVPGTADPTILAVHTAPPVPRMMDAWRDDLARLGEVDDDAARGPLILAGDLNATLRHGPLAGRAHLADTAEQCPSRAGGTWPAAAPAWAQAPIDHVLVSTDIEVVSCATLRVGASDHLVYSVELRLPGPGSPEAPFPAGAGP